VARTPVRDEADSQQPGSFYGLEPGDLAIELLPMFSFRVQNAKDSYALALHGITRFPSCS